MKGLETTQNPLEIRNPTLGSRKFEGIAVVPNCDPNAGLSVLMTYALNGVRNALKLNLLPVINFDQSTTRYFYSPVHGDNVWDYFWEPVMGLTYSDLEHLVDTNSIKRDVIHTFEPEQIWHWHQYDPDRIGTFFLRENPTNPGLWMDSKRKLGRDYVKQFIQVKQHIVRKADNFARNVFNNRIHRLGVHIRGTDLSYASPVSHESYIGEIHRYLEKNTLSEFQIFLATDQDQFVKIFTRHFGKHLVTYDSARSGNDVAPFKDANVDPYKKGEDVLIDILLLSKCDFLFKGPASVGEYAMWFNPQLKCHDFALHSSYTEKHHVLKDSAYRKLNVDNETTLQRAIRKYRRMVDGFLEAFIFDFDPEAQSDSRIALKYFLSAPKNLSLRLFRKLSKNLGKFSSRGT